MGNVLARKLEHVRRVVTHQVMEATEVAAPMLAVHAAKLVEEDAGLVAIADAELQNVQLFRQRAPGRETVPQPKQPQDELARCLRVARVALAAGQGGFVALAGGLLPQRERLPVQGVKPQIRLRLPGPQLSSGNRAHSCASASEALTLASTASGRARRKSMAISKLSPSAAGVPGSMFQGSTRRNSTGSRKFCRYWM